MRLGATIYTPAQDAAIMSNDPPCEVAARLGLRVEQVRYRRNFLRNVARQKGEFPPMKRTESERREHTAHGRRRTVRTLPFARPAWFDEDLNAMTKGALECG